MKNKINLNNSFNNPKLPKWLLSVLVFSVVIGSLSLYENWRQKRNKSINVKELAYSDVLQEMEK